MTKIEVGKTYLQNNGAKVRIVAIDLKNERPVLGLVLNDDGVETPRTYHPDGKWDQLYGDNPWNIIIPPERKSKWLNWYDIGSGESDHTSREEADKNSNVCRTHVLEVITEDGKPVDVKIHEVSQDRATQGEG